MWVFSSQLSSCGTSGVWTKGYCFSNCHSDHDKDARKQINYLRPEFCECVFLFVNISSISSISYKKYRWKVEKLQNTTEIDPPVWYRTTPTSFLDFWRAKITLKYHFSLNKSHYWKLRHQLYIESHPNCCDLNHKWGGWMTRQQMYMIMNSITRLTRRTL